MEPAENRKAVILGGFLSHTLLYSSMKNQITKMSGQETIIVPIPQYLWYALIVPQGWVPVLKRLDRTLSQIHKTGPSSKVTLIGHSIGGVLGVLYLLAPSIDGLKGKPIQGIDHLITLGSPHTNKCRWLHGGSISRLVEKHGGLSAIKHKTRVTCVAGKGVLGNKQGTASERKAYAIYKTIGGQGGVRGDGIVPVESALLPAADPIELDNVVHFAISGQAWYGSPEVVSRWWSWSNRSELSCKGT